MTTLGQRLVTARTQAGLTQNELAERVGMSQQAIADIELNKTKRTRSIGEIAHACGVTIDYLLGRSERSPTPRHGADVDIGGEDLERITFLNEFDQRFSAGHGTDHSQPNMDDALPPKPMEKWGFPTSFVAGELGLSWATTDIFRVRGDSMEDGSAKGLSGGDRVIVDRTDTDVRQGGIFAVFDGEGVIVKQVELLRGAGPSRIVCKSRNPAYDPIQLTLEAPVRVIGRVTGRISRV